MIYKLPDGTRVRTTRDGDFVGFETYRYRPMKQIVGMERLTGEAAEKRITELAVGDWIRFGMVYGAGTVQQLARTGRPSRTPLVGAVALAAVATAAALSTVLSVATDAQAPDGPYLSDVTTAPVVTPSPTRMTPYRPEPRPTTRTTREGVRETLTPSHPVRLVTSSTTPPTAHPIPEAPADIRITFYRSCNANPQPCVDAGGLTMYAGNILAGHNFKGYQWLSRVPVGRTVRVISGPLAGTYKVYGHLRLNHQGGAVPSFAGAPALVLQTCEGSGTGFSLLHRV
ncbi:hypothetical protein ACFVRU_03695 [Streptomyces sp. NPDC057927]